MSNVVLNLFILLTLLLNMCDLYREVKKKYVYMIKLRILNLVLTLNSRANIKAHDSLSLIVISH